MNPERTIGETIRRAREERGLSQEDMSRETRLSLSIIRKLELDRFAELPGGLYTRNHIRILADFLELDAGELLTRHRTGEESGQRAGASGVWIEETVPELRLARGRFRWRLWGGLVLVLLVALLVLAVARGWLRLDLGGEAQPGAGPADTGPGVATEPAGEAAPPVVAGDFGGPVFTGAPASAPPVPALRLELRASGACAVSVNVDGRRLHARRFDQDGGRWRIEATDHYLLSLRSPEALSLRLNGESVALPRSAGDLVALRLAAPRSPGS